MTTNEPLCLRLFREPQLYELARFVSYGGRRDKELKAKCEEMREQHTGNKMMWALVELTTKDEAAGLTVLKPEVRKLCKGLLGPAPDGLAREIHPRYIRRLHGHGRPDFGRRRATPV